MKKALIHWEGASGKTYAFRNYYIGTTLGIAGREKSGGVYMYVAVDEDDRYCPMQISQTDDINNQPIGPLPQVPDEVHVYYEDDETTREEIVSDLKENYPDTA